MDKGEAEVVALALEMNHDLILLDESDARKLASFYQLNFTGFIGVLLKANQTGIIDDFKVELDKAMKAGFYSNTTLYRRLMSELGK